MMAIVRLSQGVLMRPGEGRVEILAARKTFDSVRDGFPLSLTPVLDPAIRVGEMRSRLS